MPRKLAAARLAQEKPGQTLQATALVHDAYIRLVDVEEAQHWNSRAHFFGAAAEAMRRILVDNARRKRSLKQGGGWQRQAGELDQLAADAPPGNLLDLDEALKKLEQHQPVAARLVVLRYFGGLTMEEAAKVVEVPVRTAHRHWAYAKAWLRTELERQAPSGS